MTVPRIAGRPPLSPFQVREMISVSLARAVPIHGPFWTTPQGGKIEVVWMPRLGCYRITMDVIPPDPFPTTWASPDALPL